MTHVDRRTAALMALFSPLAVGAAGAQTTLKPAPMAPPTDHAMPGSSGDGIQWMGDETITMPMSAGMTAMDLIGPQSCSHR